jgi:uncharacterized membrane protein YbhN (UPF0104 family)
MSTIISEDRNLHKMHVAIFNIMYLQSTSVHKSLLVWRFLTLILTLVHVLHTFAYFNKKKKKKKPYK